MDVTAGRSARRIVCRAQVARRDLRQSGETSVAKTGAPGRASFTRRRARNAPQTRRGRALSVAASVPAAMPPPVTEAPEGAAGAPRRAVPPDVAAADAAPPRATTPPPRRASDAAAAGALPKRVVKVA